ncbi:MAG: prephenate dehydrogenase [Lachnospiraceae bacterium]|nr:prephenate dehydrogenase [Lachnospiraceae bacterium]MDD3615079.1 prephenate dehydrogenase [Lachnospiraceae bacterium]
MEHNCIGFVGLGLIGGSLAKALKKKKPEITLVAYDKDLTALTCAMKEGIIDTICNDIDQTFAQCDYIFLCAPVSYNLENLKLLKDIKKGTCILTDVGSVKGNIHEVVHDLGLDDCFIGGHPMAGSEKTGFSNSTDHLVENAYYILTPAGEVNLDAISDYMQLVADMGAIPLILTYEEHDLITAAVSHLPHIIASSLVNLVEAMDSEDEHMKSIAAGGFKDITRIASSSPEMWEQICLTNQPNISKVLDAYIKYLISIRVTLDNKNGEDLYNMFANSREYRDSLPNSSSGPIKKAYIIYCDIVDQAGAIATIATILACNAISIKNIGIVHNREFEEGVLKIEFYDETACGNAVEVLKSNRYIIYERS